ncbi:MAG TPA: DNA N-6-adenine-methyltransferase, partial [Planctomycetaceae bacterium]|nr:DNA N-6-adenine-methyltransferase [Planctomycetaceae bacterium]
AEAIQTVVRSASLNREIMNQAAQVVLEARRSVGNWLRKHGPKKGRNKKSQAATISTLEDLGLNKSQSSRWQQLAAIEDKQFYRAIEQIEVSGEDLTFEALMRAAKHTHRTAFTGNNEWYTPREYIESARRVLKTIDLDPASSEVAQQTVQAEQYFDEAADGLQQEWFGNVWLNPPYSRDLLPKFVSKLVEEKQSGNVKTAILLTHNYTDTVWFHTAEAVADRICFTLGRISFVDTLGDRCSPTQGQTFFYFGDKPHSFDAEFSKWGFVR